MTNVELVFFDAGGGHRSAANALVEAARVQNPDWQLNMMNLQELLDEMDVFRKLTGIRLQDIYNLLLRKGWTLGSAYLLPAMHGVIRLYHGQQVSRLRKYWTGHKPDLVVSLIPNFNRAIHDAMERALPGVPFVTILTDMADYPPHFWIERQVQYLICGTARAHQQALLMGHPPERVFQTSGMILHPRFYETVEVDREKERAALGLDPNLPTALMMFGGEGNARMLEIARSLDSSGIPLQIIAICGRNQKLQAAMAAMTHRIPMHVIGFTKEVPRFLRLSDFFIGKPGPGSISEALAMGVPVIVECNSWTLPQERFNAEWVTEQGVGIALSSFGDINAAAARLADPAQRVDFSARVQAIHNRAVFEIPEILGQIMRTHAGVQVANA
jgi:1,2-diacylglycerol 3-beta-galactosyltransferase